MKKITLLLVSLGCIVPSVSAQDPMLAEVRMFAGNFAPRGWALCDGQLLSISSNTALFSLLGTTYGGDGRTTFGLPDLRGRAPIHAGTGPGLSNRRLGQRGGTETVTLTVNQLPSHTHFVQTIKGAPQDDAATPAAAQVVDASKQEGKSDKAASVPTQNTGGGQSHPNMQPFLSINFIIALQGTYPSRS